MRAELVEFRRRDGVIVADGRPARSCSWRKGGGPLDIIWWRKARKPRKAKSASKYALVDAAVLDGCYGRSDSVRECRKLAEGIEVVPPRRLFAED